MKSLVRGPRRRQAGLAAVEFALVASIFLLFLLGGIEWGWYFVVSHTTMNAANEGARKATTYAGTCGSAGAGQGQTEAEKAARSVMDMIGYAKYSTINVSCLGAPDNPTWQVDMTVDFPRLIGFPFVPMPSSPTEGNTIARFSSVQRGTP